MAQQQIITKPYVEELQGNDSLFINHDGSLRQIKKSVADFASGADMRDEVAAREGFEVSVSEKFTTYDSNAAALQTEVDRLRGECDTLAAENRKQENRISALLKLNKGQTYDILTEDGETESRTAPSGAKYVSVDKVGGKSVVWNQLVSDSDSNYTNTSKTDTRDYFQLTIQSMTPYILYVSKQFYTAIGKYSVLFKPSSSSTGLRIKHNGVSFDLIMYDDVNMQITANNVYMFTANFKSIDVTTVEGVVVQNLQFFDITQMFGSTIADYIYSLEQANAGAGVAWFKQMFPANYYPYSEPTIISSQTDRVDVASSDGTVTQQITTSFPVLNSAGSVYDYIDLNEGKHHQRVGVVDLGSFDWLLDGSAYTFGKRPWLPAKNNFGAIIADYVFVKNDTDTTKMDKIFKTIKYTKSGGAIYIKDSSYTDATAFKEAMNGVMLYYELAEEVITDIDIPTELTEWLPVEAGGTVTFHNSDESKQLAVPNAVSWVRKLNEVE